ncbi:MAG: small multi-drug export protein [Prevotella sp.]|nr:small multi-drug export protein [Prevotella sp.]
MGEILSTIFGSNSILGTILIAMLPLVELKGAIPLGVSTAIWGTSALNTWQAFAWALLGSSLVVPIIALLFRPLYQWMKTKRFFQVIVDFVVGDVAKRSDKVNAEAQTASARRGLWLKIMTIFLFVAFPVPLTGVWTGTCFAVLLGLNFWVTCATVMAGNAVCGVIVTFVCQVFPQITDILLIVFLLLIALAVVAKIILHVLKKRRAKAMSTANPTHETDVDAAN